MSDNRLLSPTNTAPHVPSKQTWITIQSLHSFSFSHHSSPVTYQTWNGWALLQFCYAFSLEFYKNPPVCFWLTHFHTSTIQRHFLQTIGNSSLLALISTIMIGLLISLCLTDSTSILPHGLSFLNTILLIADNADRPSTSLRAPTN